MQNYWHRFRQFIRFYLAADTRFQVHSPFVFEFAQEVLEDKRWYYAFRDIEAIRDRMQESAVALDVFGQQTEQARQSPGAQRKLLRQIARTSASAPLQGRWLFRLALWRKPQVLLELGTSVGIGAMYLASAVRNARFLSLEGSEACTHVARANLGILGLNHRTEVITGPFDKTLDLALRALGQVDLIFFDGHHRHEPTIRYFEQCLNHAHDGTVLVFDDIHWSPEMTDAWKQIQLHPRVTLTVDCFELAFVFLQPDFNIKQHFQLVPTRWKPWKLW